MTKEYENIGKEIHSAGGMLVKILNKMTVLLKQIGETSVQKRFY